jgi:hypothetical protein
VDPDGYRLEAYCGPGREAPTRNSGLILRRLSTVEHAVDDPHFPVPGGAAAPASQAASVGLGPASESSQKKVAICLLDSPR